MKSWQEQRVRKENSREMKILDQKKEMNFANETFESLQYEL